MPYNPKRTVVEGYDKIALEYLGRFRDSAVRDKWLEVFINALPKHERSSVLDLGCGAGVPVASKLATLGMDTLGVDSSARQIELARVNVSGAEFLCADMTELNLSPASFDGICAFYSISHVPASEQRALIGGIADWLKPGGVFLGSFGVAPGSGDWQGDWLGTQMFFSHNDRQTTLSHFEDAGLLVELAEEMVQDNEDAIFLWIMARKSKRALARWADEREEVRK